MPVIWSAPPQLLPQPAVQARLLRVDREENPGAAGKIQDWIERLKGKVVRISPEQVKEIVPWLRKVSASSS